MNRRTALAPLALALLSIPAKPQQAAAPSQQIIQPGALNVPSAVLTDSGQWVTLLPILSAPDVDLFIEDPSNDAWLLHNAQPFIERGQYTLILVSWYKNLHACRADQVHAGLSDAEHIDACNNYRYAVRRIAVDAPQNAVTVLFSAKVFSGGILDDASIRRETHTRGITELDINAQKALADANKLIAKESRAYAIRQQPSAQ